MAQRRFGPTRGAGVAIIEKSGDKTIEPGALGWAGYAGILQRGPVGELIMASTKKSFESQCGSYIDDSVVPDCANDYYSLANGAGGLALVRVTDGNELQAEATLYARYAGVATPMGTLKAANGGRWGGKQKYVTGNIVDAGDLTETTIDTGVTMKVDEYKGGWIDLAENGKRYEIVGNDAAGVITVAGDSTVLTDYVDSASVETFYYLALENEGLALSYSVVDGEEKPDEEFGLIVYLDGVQVRKWPNLSTNPANARYWVSIINDDDTNYYVTAVDLWTGAHTPAVRPASIYGKISTVTETVLTAVVEDVTISSPTGADPTVALSAMSNTSVAQKFTITMSSATEGAVVSDKFGALGTITAGTPFTTDWPDWIPTITLTAGATPLVAADIIVVNFKPFEEDSLIGGSLYPDKVNEKLERFRIVANTYNTITVADGSDMTINAATDDEFMVVAPIELEGGRDGNSELTDADYNQQAWDTEFSPFNRLEGRNMGLVKFATPGVSSTSVQKAGVAYADAKNHQYRYQAPSNVTTEESAIALVNDTLGRSDYAVLAFPSYCYVSDPLGGGQGKRKLVPNTGMIHGREARIAVDYDGYHKAQAGIDAKLPAILDTPVGEAILNEELLNPVGIAVIKKNKGNYIIWGDRTLNTDPTWKWKHQREQMSYYEHVLQENFDWIVFAINDSIEWPKAQTALDSFFLKEWQPKRALRGATYKEACIIKIDSENNTNVTMADGDMNAEVSLRLADTVERFIITIGKQGIFDAAQ